MRIPIIIAAAIVLQSPDIRRFSMRAPIPRLWACNIAGATRSFSMRCR